MYTLPTFNLTCNIWTTGAYPPAPKRLSSACNLAWGRRIHSDIVQGNYVHMSLLLPALTDIRCQVQLAVSGTDAVEVPAGSGRYYVVLYVDDIGKGFANEHRCAILVASPFVNGVWPTPMP